MHWDDRAGPKKPRPPTPELPRRVQATPGADEQAFVALLRKIERDRQFRCWNYKDTCLRRRISVRMRARGVSTFDQYAGILDTDPLEYDKLVDALTINVSKFFRNPETFACIAA